MGPKLMGKMICFGSSLVSDGKNGGKTKSGTGGIITGLEHRSKKKRLRTSTESGNSLTVRLPSGKLKKKHQENVNLIFLIVHPQGITVRTSSTGKLGNV